jgi:hypothetical protein
VKLSMSEKNLVAAIVSRYESIPAEERRRRITEFASEERLTKDFLRRHFPDLYREVFGSSPYRGGQFGKDAVEEHLA